MFELWEINLACNMIDTKIILLNVQIELNFSVFLALSITKRNKPPDQIFTN